MISERTVTVLVAVVQERSRHLAAIIATMPLTAPLAMWIVFSASSGNQRQTADFVGAMVIGSVASLGFAAGIWFPVRLARALGHRYATLFPSIERALFEHQEPYSETVLGARFQGWSLTELNGSVI